jgi:hypothetical protein
MLDGVLTGPVGMAPDLELCHGFELVPGRGPVDNLVPGDGSRIWCNALMLDPGRMSVTAGGLEQTRITYGFICLMGKYDGLNIDAVKTMRSHGDAALSYFVLSHVSGRPNALRTFAEDITQRPWFEPGGRRITPRAAVNLTVIARDRTRLLRDELEIVSGKYDANIESLVNLHLDEHEHEHERLLRGRAGPGGRGAAPPAGLLGRYSRLVSVTRMRLEVEHAADIPALIRDLRQRGEADAAECGAPWRVIEEVGPTPGPGTPGHAGRN